MRRASESLLSPAGLIPTLQSLGVRGIIPTGALAWNTYPAGATSPIFSPGTISGVDGPAIGFIAPNLLSLPYQVTHLNWSSRNNKATYIGQWKIQNSLGVTKRMLRLQNPAKVTAGQDFGQTQVASLMPFPMLPSIGTQAVFASNSPEISPTPTLRAYLTALLVQPQIVPALLAVAPTALGAVLPTTAAGTVATQSVTSWAYGSYVQLTAGLATGALITAVIFSSVVASDSQVSFATGGAGSEVDWGVFGWAEPISSNLIAARYDLQPYPLYLPPSTRLAARARGTDGSGTFNVGIEYIPIPIR